jgi:hypothetical protein
MKLLTVLAATAVAAAAAAAISIPAGANPSAGDNATKIAACLRAHGAAGAPAGGDPRALKQWVAAHPSDAAVKPCLPQASPPTELLSCLRAHGLTPPANLFQLKPWMVRQAGTAAGKAKLHACRVDFDRPTAAGAGKDLAHCLRSHGADVPAGADDMALKTWIVRHSGEASTRRALQLCGSGAPGDAPKAPRR